MKRGFTLIELLVVMSIIGILAALAMTGFTAARKNARDTQRKSDLGQYRIALEAYSANNGGKYPGRMEREAHRGDCICYDLSNYLVSCPQDAMSGKTGADGYPYDYYYESDSASGGVATATKWLLWAQLETGGYWEICSDGKIGKVAGWPGSRSYVGNCTL